MELFSEQVLIGIFEASGFGYKYQVSLFQEH